MFEVWMMTTNFLICVAAVLGTSISLQNKLVKPNTPERCSCEQATLRYLERLDSSFSSLPRCVLTRQDATIAP